jgi:hypothetical protein
MENKNGPRYPIREWLGLYSKWLLVMNGRKALRDGSNAIERFLDTFPKYKGLEQFTSIDVADFFAIHAGRLSPASLEREGRHVEKFWKWLVTQKGLPIHNIFRAYRNKLLYTSGRKKLQGWTLPEVLQLINECSCLHTKRFIVKVMQGASSKNCGGWLRKEVREAAARIGRPGFQFHQIRNATQSRLSQDIIKAYCDQILNTFPEETKSACDTFATVDTSTLNKGTAVFDRDNDFLTVKWVTEEQPRAEG